jgi:hypothetical protein
MAQFTSRSLEKRRARRKKQAARNMETGDQAIKNALEKGFITKEQVMEYREMKRKKEVEKQKLKKDLKFKRPARIFTGLNTNSM